MPGWFDIVNEINNTNPYDSVRNKYLKKLFDKTGRNVIAYYSAFVTKNGPGLSIDESDIEGFMTAIKDLDKTLGLDLILHTPGGFPTATEGIVKYLRSIFGTNIKVIVPQIAMSAGTMVACSGKEIIMGKQSSLGPIDPQINGMAAFNIQKVFDDAKKDLKEHPENLPYWSIQFQKYPPSLIYDCIKSIELSEELVSEWLTTGMFEEEGEAATNTIKSIVQFLNQNEQSKNHGRHFDKETCKRIGLKVVDLEDDNELQDTVLSVHHCYMALLSNTDSSKIIENQNGKRMVNHAAMQQLPPQIQMELPLEVPPTNPDK